MPKWPSLTPQKTIKILEKKGFILDRVKGNTVHLAGRAPMPGGVGAASAVLSKPYWG